MSPNIYRITLKRVTRLFCYLFVVLIYIYVYFHVMTDIYFRELLKSIIPLSLIGRRSNIYTLVF